jgi:multiple sugar transport system permease protein
MRKAGAVVSYIILVVGALVMAFPFYWMVVSSFKSFAEIAALPPTWLPAKLDYENYIFAMQAAPFFRFFINSTIVTVSVVLLTLFTTILAAFAFSRLSFPGRDVIFALFIGLMMIPWEMLIITNYGTISDLGLLDNYLSLIIPFLASIFYTYMLRNFFLGIPDTLYYAARVDGASNWTYLWRIMVPLAKPAIVTIVLLNSLLSWNAFMWPLMVTNAKTMRTLPVGLYSFVTDAGIRYERLMAAATIVILPMILLFLATKKNIVTAVSRGGIKG